MRQRQIKTIKDIRDTEEGKMLLASVAILSTTVYSDKTPDECVCLVRKLRNKR